VDLEARKFARCYCLVTALNYVRNTSLHLLRECVWLIGAVEYPYRQTQNIRLCLYFTLSKLINTITAIYSFLSGAVADGA